MTELSDFTDNIRGKLEDTDESPETTDLHLTKDEYMEKMRREEDGEELLALLESGEFRVVERMGLCHGYIEEGTVVFDVPRWNNLIGHLRIVNSV
jgi:hypothetical protein